MAGYERRCLNRDRRHLLLTRVHVRNFRTVKDAAFRPGPSSTLVGEPGTGKSSLLAASEPHSTQSCSTPEDVPETGTGPIRIDLETRSDATCNLEGELTSTSSAKIISQQRQ
jgi:recombinational DNA repair ATPase RecF